MNKNRNIPAADRKTTPKRTIANFVRKAPTFEPEKKSGIFESQFQDSFRLKRPNESWDY